MFVCVGFNLSFGLLASRARSRFSEGTDLCGSGGTRVPAVRFMELDLLVAGDNDSAEKSTISVDFPPFPGEQPLAHAATIFQEKAENILTSLGLLTVVRGGEPTAVRSIIDTDLSELPELPPGDPGYERRVELRIRYITQNKANAEKRLEITMKAWTKAYTLFKACTEKTAPVLSRELLEMCDLSKTRNLAGGWFDGPTHKTCVVGGAVRQGCSHWT